MPRPVLDIQEPYTPELLPVVTAAIERLVGESARVFEYGSGYSTVWFAGLCHDVTAVEHDPQWAEETERALREAQRWSKVNLITVDDEADIGAAIDHYGDFDLILVDCLDRQRTAAVEHAMSHVAPGGYLVLDDSQWRMLDEARQMLSGWRSTVVSGLHTRKSGDVREHETTFYRRPLEAGDEEE